MPEKQPRIFLSYAQPDTEFAERLSDLIERAGASVFDARRILPGESLSNTIRQELEKASAVIMLLPAADASNRNQVWFEAGAAKALGKRVLAVLPPSHRLHSSELPGDLADIIVLDADERPLDQIADTLVTAAGQDKAEAVAH